MEEALKNRDRRQAPRYELRLPVSFRWTTTKGIRCEGSGVSRDVSNAGVYVRSEHPPPPETAVKLVLVLRAQEEGDDGVHLAAEGNVVRVETGGFAIALVGEVPDITTGFYS